MEYTKLLSADATLARQKAKVTWLRNAEKNTKFYHAKIKQRRARSQINSVVDSWGNRVTQEKEIQGVFLKYYMELLGTVANGGQDIKVDVLRDGKILSEEQSNALIAPIQEMEIKEAFFAVGNDKSPGPDGFSAGFFKSTWHIIKEEVVAAITDFFVSGKILKQINSTNLCLIPKIENPSSPSDFRPIACCNIVYKAITRIMAARLQNILDSIISQNQTAFIPGRLIMSNILICQDLVRGYKRSGGQPKCLMKIDLRKAYDSVRWGFIQQVLIGLNFPQKFVHWVMLCISTAQYSVVVNGVLWLL